MKIKSLVEDNDFDLNVGEVYDAFYSDFYAGEIVASSNTDKEDFFMYFGEYEVIEK